jgi:hypothetical protein
VSSRDDQRPNEANEIVKEDVGQQWQKEAKGKQELESLELNRGNENNRAKSEPFIQPSFSPNVKLETFMFYSWSPTAVTSVSHSIYSLSGF